MPSPKPYETIPSSLRERLAPVILAAGRGSRLQPLTDHVPKPLLPVKGIPLLYWHFWHLRLLGWKDVYVNIHHLKDSMISYIQKQPFLKVHLSEEPTLLGVGGGIQNMAKKIPTHQDLLVINADILYTYPLLPLIEAHFQHQSWASMMVRKSLEPQENPLWCFKSELKAIGKVASPGNWIPRGFACIQILSRAFTRALPEGPSEIIPFYKEILPEQRIYIHESQGVWTDMGTPKTYGYLEKELEKPEWAPLLKELLAIQSVLRQTKS